MSAINTFFECAECKGCDYVIRCLATHQGRRLGTLVAQSWKPGQGALSCTQSRAWQPAGLVSSTPPKLRPLKMAQKEQMGCREGALALEGPSGVQALWLPYCCRAT